MNNPHFYGEKKHPWLFFKYRQSSAEIQFISKNGNDSFKHSDYYHHLPQVRKICFGVGSPIRSCFWSGCSFSIMFDYQLFLMFEE